MDKEKMSLTFRTSIVLCILLSTILACLSTNADTAVSLVGFSNSAIEGVWQADYSFPNGHGAEILTFTSEDNTYSQIFEDTSGFLYSGTGTWEIETDSNGRVFVRLNNALWFPLGAENALLKGMDPYSPGYLHGFYDHQTNTFTQMPDMLILEVIPRDNSKGFDLFHFAWGIDNAPEHFDPIIE